MRPDPSVTSADRHRNLRLAWIIGGVVSTVLVIVVRLAWPAGGWLFGGSPWAFAAIMVAYHHGWLRRDDEGRAS